MENKQSRYAAIPSRSHWQNDVNTSLQRAVTLAFIGPHQLLIGGGRRQCSRKQHIGGIPFRALGFGFAHSITQLHRFISPRSRRFRAESDPAVPSPPCSPITAGSDTVRNVSGGGFQGFQFRTSVAPQEASDFICSYLRATYTTFSHFLTETIPCLILTVKWKCAWDCEDNIQVLKISILFLIFLLGLRNCWFFQGLFWFGFCFVCLFMGFLGCVFFCFVGWLGFLVGWFLVLLMVFCSFSERPKVTAQLFPLLSSFLCLSALTADKWYLL